MKSVNFEDLTDKCITLIKKYKPDICINKFIKFTNPKTSKKLTPKEAFEIYNLLSDYSVEYDPKLYGNNIKKYNNKILKNIDIAEKEYIKLS